MTNPYAVTSASTGGGGKRPSVVLGLLGGLLGYLAPVVILFGFAWGLYGWPAATDNLARVYYLHQKTRLAGLTAMAPNIACLLLFAMAGYRRCFRVPPNDLWNPLALGLSTLVGYGLMLLVTSFWFHLPWTWSAERVNLIRFGIVMVTPLLVVAIRWIWARRKR